MKLPPGATRRDAIVAGFTIFVLCLLASLAGCVGPTTREPGASLDPYTGSYVRVHRDEGRGVTCWVYVGYGIDCISDTGEE